MLFSLLTLFLVTHVTCYPPCFNEYHEEKRTITNNGSTLDLSDCGIRGFTLNQVSDPHKLREIIAKHNKIKKLEERVFITATSVTKINLNYNQIELIEPTAFNGLSKLEHLFLAENRIKNLKPGTFHDLKSLKILIISRNQLEILEDGLIVRNLGLERIDLRGNQLKKIEENSLENLAKLQSLNLLGNQCFNASLAFKNSNDSDIKSKILEAYQCKEKSIRTGLNDGPSKKSQPNEHLKKYTIPALVIGLVIVLLVLVIALHCCVGPNFLNWGDIANLIC
jgi:Leucine-rich repeat (LRR) protein